MSEAKRRTAWSDHENDVIVADYMTMLNAELAGKHYVKTEHNRKLQGLIGRNKGSIEFKHQNISAVLFTLGLPYIVGYKPRFNIQASLVDAVERWLAISAVPEVLMHPKAAADILLLAEQPALSAQEAEHHSSLRRLVRKFDPAARDAANRELGRLGEQLILDAECRRLSREGRHDLARKVDWISETRGDGAGYDILSFELDGCPRHLEVKTTRGHHRTPFYISANELEVSAELGDQYRIVRVYDFSRQPSAFELSPPISDVVHLQPLSFRASFGY